MVNGKKTSSADLVELKRKPQEIRKSTEKLEGNVQEAIMIRIVIVDF